MSSRRNLATLTAWLLVVLSFLLPGSAAAQQQSEENWVPHNWVLLPDGLGAEDRFRVLVVTEGKFPPRSSTDIADYNKFVQDQVRSGLLMGDPVLRQFAGDFRVVGSTSSVDARVNTSMQDFAGQSIYWVNGARVANNHHDFYDGSWDSYEARFPNGSIATNRNLIATGTQANGSKAVDAALGNRTRVRYGSLKGAPGEPQNPLDSAYRTGGDLDSGSSYYAISPILNVKRKITLSATPASAKEGAQRTLTIKTAGGHSEARTIKVKFIDDPDIDFLPADLEQYRGESLRTIEIKARPTTTTIFDFTTKVDPWTDKSGKFTVEISESFGGQPADFDYGTDGKHSVEFTVTNDPDKSHPTVSLSSVPPAAGDRTDYLEGVDPGAFFRVTLDKPWPLDTPLKVNVRVFDDETSNFLVPSEERTRTVTFAKGSSLENLQVHMIADGTKSNDGEITAEVVSGSPTVRGPDADDPRKLASHTVKILNNAAYDDRVVSVVDSELTVNEGGQAVFTLEVDQAPADGATVTAELITDAPELSRRLGRTVPAAATPQTAGSPVAGADFTRPVSLTINWPSGQKRATLAIPIVDDMPYEGDEVFGVKFIYPRGVSFEGTSELFAFATINDDDDTPELTADSPSVKEGNNDRDSAGTRNTLDYKFTLSTTSTLPVQFLVRDTLSGTADSKDETDVDAVADTTLVIPAGDTSVTHKVTINGDTDVESDETVVLRLSQLRNARFPNSARTLDATGTITDDDGVGEPRVVIRHVGPSKVSEGEKVRFRLEVIDSVSRKPVALEKECTYLFAAVPTGAVYPNDYTPSTHNVTIPKGSSLSDVFEYQTIKDEEEEEDEVFGSTLYSGPRGCPKTGYGLQGYSNPTTTIT